MTPLYIHRHANACVCTQTYINIYKYIRYQENVHAYYSRPNNYIHIYEVYFKSDANDDLQRSRILL